MLVGHKITKSLCTEDDLRLQDEMTSIILARRRESRRLRLIYLAAVVALVLIIQIRRAGKYPESICMPEERANALRPGWYFRQQSTFDDDLKRFWNGKDDN